MPVERMLFPVSPCVRVPPPGPACLPVPAVGGSRQAGAALLRGNGEVGELVSENPNPPGDSLLLENT